MVLGERGSKDHSVYWVPKRCVFTIKMAQSGSLSDTLKDTVTLSRELREEGKSTAR